MNAGIPEQLEKIEVASVGAGYAAKGITFKDDVTPTCSNANAQYEGYASKGIMFSEDPAPVSGGQVASYVVKKVSEKTDKTLFLKLKLVHE